MSTEAEIRGRITKNGIYGLTDVATAAIDIIELLHLLDAERAINLQRTLDNGALHEKCDELRTENDNLVMILSGANTLSKILQDENERLRADAERYRWIRSHAWTEQNAIYYGVGADQSQPGTIDEAIDAAMKESEKL